MKKKKIFYAALSFFLIATGISLIIVSLPKKNSKEKEPEYLPCPVLKDGETMDVIQPSSLHPRWSASYTAMFEKREGRCVDAWVNEDGMLVVRYDRETLEQEYKRVYDILMTEIDVSNTSKDFSKIKMKVSYDYSEIYMYVSADADINDFGSSVMVAPIACVYLRLLQGLSLEEAIMVELIYIYEPTGKEMLRIGERTDDFHMNQDDWQKLLEEARQG